MQLTHVFACCALFAGLVVAQDGLPPASQPEPAGERGERSGAVSEPRSTKPTRVQNHEELKRLGLIPATWLYEVEGTFTEHALRAEQIELTEPHGPGTIRMTRFEGFARVAAGADGRVVATVDGTPRVIQRNPFSRLDELVEGEVRARGAGTLVIRGWVVDAQDAGIDAASIVLDGVEASVGRYAPTWATRLYNHKGKANRPVIEQARGDFIYAHPVKKATLTRSAVGLSGALPN